MKKILLLAMMAIAVNAFNAFSAQTGALPGKFYVGNGKYVQFSKGNLQYNIGDATFNFAEHQYDVVGNDNVKVTELSYKGMIDLFGWGTGNNPVFTSQDNASYDTIVDWGVNPIVNGGNQANQWRTPTRKEWRYLIMERRHARELLGYAKIDGICGAVLLPDDWTLPEGCTFVPILSVEYELVISPTLSQWLKMFEWYDVSEGCWQRRDGKPFEQCGNIYTAEDWSKMEAAGAVFFPCSGSYDYKDYGSPDDIWGLNWLAPYWSSTVVDGTEYSYQAIFSQYAIYPTGNDIGKFNRSAVRLLTEVEPCTHPHALPGFFSVADGKRVQFAPGNLQYDLTNEVYSFAANQIDYIGDANVRIAGTDPATTGKIDLFGWGTGDRPTFASTNNYDYATFVDWNTQKIVNGGNRTDVWRTLTRDEWRYLFRVRANAQNLFGYGMINDVTGLILLPDDWELPEGSSFTPLLTLSTVEWDATHSEGSWFINSGTYPYETNKYTFGPKVKEDTWSVMEAAGAVFLPCSGFYTYDSDTKIWGEGWLGVYMCATPTEFDDEVVYQLVYTDDGLYPTSDDGHRYDRSSVRLIKDEGIGDGVEAIAPKQVNAVKRIVDGELRIEVNGRVFDAMGRVR